MNGAAHETGAGTVLALAVLGAILAALTAVLPFVAGLSVRQSVVAAADAAALAGADVAVGFVPGIPCLVAARVAAADGARLTRCESDGLIVTVQATRSFLGVSLLATATAGPPR